MGHSLSPPSHFILATGLQLYMLLLALAFKIDEKAFNYEHYPSILVSFLGKTEHFSRENGAF